MMKLLIADKIEDEAVNALKALPNLEVVHNPSVSKDALAQALSGVHIVVVRSKEVRAPAIQAARQLALIVRAGAGTNTIDVEAASARGVYVANCPGKNAIAVAELAIGLMLAIDRRLPDATSSLRAGKWEKAEFGKADGLYGKRLGIAGLGSIGREVLFRARSLGLKVQAWSRSLTGDAAREIGVERAESLIALAAQSDILSVHLPLTPGTKGIINAEVLAALPQRAMVINTARAEVLDYAALQKLAVDKELRIGLDVFPDEPEGGKGNFQSELLTALPGWVATPHVGASTSQAQLAIASETVRIVRSFLETGSVPNCVNLARRSPARCQLIVRHYDRVGVLASVLGVIKKHGINVEDMANQPFEGHQAAVAKLSLAQLPSEECVKEIEASSNDVIHVEAIAI
jgi:D-3-phosphoglycerate dehydrogenase